MRNAHNEKYKKWEMFIHSRSVLESRLAAFQDIVSYSTSTLLSFWSPETGSPKQRERKREREKKKRQSRNTKKYEVKTLYHG